MPGCPGGFSSSIHDFQKHVSKFPKLLSGRSLKQNAIYLFVKRFWKEEKKEEKKIQHMTRSQKLKSWPKNIFKSLSQPTLFSFSYCSYSAIISIAMVTAVQLFCEAWDLNT